jgi:hypothetical protein
MLLLTDLFLVAPNSNFSLTAPQVLEGIYFTDVDGNPKGPPPEQKPIPGIRMTTTVYVADDVPAPSPERQMRKVKTVFPVDMEFMFDQFGDTFTGGYRGINNKLVYACKGEARWGALGVAFPGAKTGTTKPRVRPLKDSLIAHRRAAPGRKVTDEPLTCPGLLSMDPYYLDPEGRERDRISDAVMENIQQITLYFMDEDLRATFISPTPIQLDPEIKSIAENNPDNKKFYKSLQTPFLVSMLTSPSGSKFSPFFFVR